ncbi:diacylglycerol O-acyltransferase 2-like, partial [Leucoraja erinacea]|uniref:diacylglycerol O-acyltransferase 2-like n=1 Tax=Leucoraja erinaceus TaxID=7782 RepID=UPI0024561745
RWRGMACDTRVPGLLEALCVYQWGDLTNSRLSPGGRRSQWIRECRIWKRMSDYFPVTLVKTAELDPKRNYVLGYHPHGILCVGGFVNFCTEGTGFSQVFPGITPHMATLNGLFHLPVYREFLLSSGACPVSKEGLGHILGVGAGGEALVIVVGGRGRVHGRPSTHTRGAAQDRSGFIRVALEHGADLVPVYCFGETALYDQAYFEPSSWAGRLQRGFQKAVGFAPCVFRGRGLLPPRSWGLLPFSRPLTTVVGAPIRVDKTPSPSQEDIARYHALYQQALRQLFDQHKVRCGLPENAALTIY